MNILIIAGEVSGDIYGGHLATYFLRKNKDVPLFSIGGKCLKKHSFSFLYDSVSLSSIGVYEYLKKRTFYQKLYATLESFLKKETQSKNLTLVPIKIYSKKHIIKIEIALARGKKKYEKRRVIIERERARESMRALKNNK